MDFVIVMNMNTCMVYGAQRIPLVLPWTSRGTGRCPKCKAVYSTARKPKTCGGCQCDLGSSYEPIEK